MLFFVKTYERDLAWCLTTMFLTFRKQEVALDTKIQQGNVVRDCHPMQLGKASGI